MHVIANNIRPYLKGKRHSRRGLATFFVPLVSAVVLMVATISTVAPGTAHAALWGPYRIDNLHTAKCMGVAGASTANGASIVQWDCLPISNDRLHYLQDVPGWPGWYYIKPLHT